VTNILTAINTIVAHPISDLVSYYQGSNRINQIGDALECFIKDIFADTVTESDQQRKLLRYAEVFSYSGNANNPPDLMLRNGDAIKIRQIESLSLEIRLTDSYPRAKLFFDDPVVSKHCRTCENWNVKDLLYIIGVTENNLLTDLWLVYGDCYFAEREIYENVISRRDPLGITSFSSGKSKVALPKKNFDYCNEVEDDSNFRLYCIMKMEKCLSFPENDRKQVESLTLNQGLTIGDISIKSPNTPQWLMPAKLIKFLV